MGLNKKMMKDSTIQNTTSATDHFNISKKSKKIISKKFKPSTIIIERNSKLYLVVIQMLLEEILLLWDRLNLFSSRKRNLSNFLPVSKGRLHQSIISAKKMTNTNHKISIKKIFKLD